MHAMQALLPTKGWGYGQFPRELQQQIVSEVEQAKTRSDMPVTVSLKHLGVSRWSYFRWKKEESWKQEPSKPAPPVQAFEAFPEEKQADVKYALDHPGIRHRELSWRMIDADVAYLSMSTVYRILRTENLMCSQRGRKKRDHEEIEKASRPDEVWATDLMYLTLVL
jgi:hypothetical protein